jgi:hypothetical protein
MPSVRMVMVDVSAIHWAGSLATCPDCGRPTRTLLVLTGGHLACPACTRTFIPKR